MNGRPSRRTPRALPDPGVRRPRSGPRPSFPPPGIGGSIHCCEASARSSRNWAAAPVGGRRGRARRRSSRQTPHDPGGRRRGVAPLRRGSHGPVHGGAPVVAATAQDRCRPSAVHDRAVRARPARMYLALDVLAVGSAVWVPTVPVVTGALLLIVGGELRARLEEQALAQAFGERYHDYAKRVPRRVLFG